jgi:hypothetical protein
MVELYALDSGAAQPKLTQERLMNIAIVVPPREEQDRIVRLQLRRHHAKRYHQPLQA